MPLGRSGLALMTLLLAGACARPVDDPANPPRRGQWHDVTTLTGVRLNDRGVRDEEMPAGLREKIAAFAKNSRFCGEPRPRERSEMQALLDEKFDACTIETFDLIGPAVSALARCRPRNMGGQDVRLTARISGIAGADRISLDIDGMSRLTEKTGGDYVLVISGRRQLTRLGDCQAIPVR